MLLTALLGISLLAGCSDTPPPPPSGGPLPVSVLEVQPQKIPATIDVVAQTEGARETEVRARVGGILMQRLYREGESVKAGQPLFQIDRAPYEIALAEATARAAQAEREANRLKGLAEAKAVSQKAYEDAVTASAIAQASLRQARLNLSWTTVTAPVAGTTGRAYRSEGNLVTAGTDSLLTTIYQSDPIWVSFSLGDSDLAKFPGGRASEQNITGVSLILPDGSVYEKPGKLNFVASHIDTTLGTQALRATFDNPEHRLLPGQFVRVRLAIGEQEGVYLVPQSAVIQTEQGSLLMLAGADNTVTPQPVRTGEWVGRDWVVLDGLKPGDRVIVDHLMKLRPGMPVAPKPQGAPAGTPEPGSAAPAGRK